MAFGFRGKRVLGCSLLTLCLPFVAGALGLQSDLNRRVLAAHNRERATLGLPSMRWDARLAAEAKDWADHLSRTGDFAHSPNISGRPREGENIWGGTVSAYSPESMVALWVAEKRNFLPGTFPNNSRTGRVEDVSHYTQVMWRRTYNVGCGLSRGVREDILVCRYSEAGNIIGGTIY